MEQPGRADSEELVFAIVSGDPMARVSLERVCGAITIRGGVRLRAEILESYGLMPERLSAGSVHVAWAPPLVAQTLSQRLLATAVCCPRRLGGQAYHAALFAKSRTKFRGIEDLEGARAAWVDRMSLSGHVLARRWCERKGRDPDRLLSQQMFLKTHSAVARAVLGGQADIGATYANVDPKTGRIVDAGWSEIGAGVADVQLIATIGPVPADAIVVSSTVAEAVRSDVAAGLCGLTGAAQAAVKVLFRAERFERAPPGYLSMLADLGGR